ncbi:hypothetical protein DW757_01925 [Clostridium sp. AM29-11AC]|nr:hypothetical protein DW757_01925 [Clostridium sp. AM29-11AC]
MQSIHLFQGRRRVTERLAHPAERKMPPSRPAAGGESCEAGFFLKLKIENRNEPPRLPSRQQAGAFAV